MAYKKRTCCECGWSAPQPEMVQRVRRVEVARGRGSISGATVAGALLGHKASGRKIGNTIFNSGQRSYSRKVTSWFCEDCAPAAESGDGAGVGVFVVGLLLLVGMCTAFTDDNASTAPGDASIEEQGVAPARSPDVASPDVDTVIADLVDEQPQPSFDCTLASTSTERAICSSVTLSDLDRSAAKSYSLALTLVPDEVARGLAKSRMETRDTCGADMSCLEREMSVTDMRLQALVRYPEPQMEGAFISLAPSDRRAVQNDLKRRGVYPAEVDGTWGPGTEYGLYTALLNDLDAGAPMAGRADAYSFVRSLSAR